MLGAVPKGTANEFLRFAVVGLWSAVLNTSIIVLLTEFGRLHYTISIILCFLLVTVFGFMLNRKWSFRIDSAEWREEMLRYSLVAGGGLFATIVISWKIVSVGFPYYIATAAAAALMAPVNFLFHRSFSFSLSWRDAATSSVAMKEPIIMRRGLRPYDACPARSPHSCTFALAPVASIETGHPLAPHVEVFRCGTCGHGVTRPAMSDVTLLYKNRESEDFQKRDAAWIRMIKRIHGSSLVRTLTAFAPFPPSLVIDYGTGNGLLARCLADHLPKTSVIGLDFFEEPPGDMGQASYYSFDAAASKGLQADFLTCFHVLEHDDDPHVMLERVLNHLSVGGIFILEVPNIDCVWTAWFGNKCENWYAPFHRLHFSRESLRSLVKEHGLSVLSEQAICGPTFALSLARVLGVRPNSLIFAIAVALRPLQLLAEKLSQRPSALRIITRKN